MIHGRSIEPIMVERTCYHYHDSSHVGDIALGAGIGVLLGAFFLDDAGLTPGQLAQEMRSNPTGLEGKLPYQHIPNRQAQQYNPGPTYQPLAQGGYQR